MDVKILQDVPPWDWPRNAARLFIDALTDRKAGESDRLIAAGLAGNLVVMNDDLAAVLLGVLQNSTEPEALRAQAAISFGPVLEQASADGFEDPDEMPISERTYHEIGDALRNLYMDRTNPKKLRRRILEASVRDPQDWHREAIREAYTSGERDRVLTAVFAMRYVRGFDGQIMEALKSDDPEIHFEAIQAAGNWQAGAAWPHVLELVKNRDTPKHLLLAAISAMGSIRPYEAAEYLVDLADSADEDIAEVAHEAMSMAKVLSNLDDGEEDEEEDANKWIN